MARTNVTTVKVLVEEYARRIQERFANVATLKAKRNELMQEMNKAAVKVIVHYAEAQFPFLKNVKPCAVRYSSSTTDVQPDKIVIVFEAKPVSNDIRSLNELIAFSDQKEYRMKVALSKWKEKALLAGSKNVESFDLESVE